MWLSHRPNKTMFSKIAIVVSTASGAGANKVTKALSQQMFWLGIPKVFRYSKNVNAANWKSVPDKIKNSIEKDTSRLAIKVESKLYKVKPGLRLRTMFFIMKMMQKSNDWNMLDRGYWEENGWLDKGKPW